jgi:hypothetical protein
LLRTSERSDFKRCPFLWEQTWLKGRRSKREPTWAWFGTAIHRGLEARYLPGGKKRGSLDEMYDAFEESLGKQERRIYTEGLDVPEEEIVDARTLGREMLKGYFLNYGKDQHWKVLHTEQPFQINVPDPDNPDNVLVVYCGTWDLAVWDMVEKVFKIVDHKTRKAFLKNWNFYKINDQAGSYLWVAPEVLVHKGILKKGDRIEGLVFNALRKAMPDKRPTDADGRSLNKDGSVSKVQPSPLFHREEVWRSPAERVTQAQRVQKEAVAMEQMRREPWRIYKTPTEDCNRCPIFEFCELHESDPEAAEEFADATLLVRDPYRDHRVDMVERGGVHV